MTSMTLHVGDVVLVIAAGPHVDRVGAIYDLMGVPRDRWKRINGSGESEYRVYFDHELDADWFTEDELRVVEPMPPPRHAAGERVRITTAAYWARGETGTVGEESLSPVRQRSGPTRVYTVWFDHPQDDGSGQGPYISGEFSDIELELLDQPPAR